jgi:hypothetical protein
MLGLDRTDDVGEIRRAYARRLKATDVDADPAAFDALRQALERALADAARLAGGQAPSPVPAFERQAQAPAIFFRRARTGKADPPAPAPKPPAVAEKEPEVADIAPEVGDEAPEVKDEPAPEAADAPAVEDRNARFVALNRLLFAGEGALPPDPAALAAAVRAIVDHTDMDRVDHGAEVESWLAEALYHSIPRSDPVIPMAVAHFGWEAELGAARRRQLIALVAQRAEDLACIARLRKVEHRWHDAFVELSRPSSGQIGFGDRVRFKPEVAQLLNGLRIHYPDVERQLDAEQVTRWDRDIGRAGHIYLDRSDRISWYGWLAVAWLLLNVATLSVQAFR